MALKPCLDCRALTAAGSRCRACQARRDRARSARSPYRTGAWQRTAAATIRRDGGACTRCGSARRLTAHHVIPRAAGGPDRLDNLITLCASCHSRLEARKRSRPEVA